MYLVMFHLSIVDIDECNTDMHNCDVEATCINTDGGFFCECNAAFSGNGTHCEGKTTSMLQLYDLSYCMWLVCNWLFYITCTPII